ncbi:olfactory receptor 14J1-like [Cygnus atratus]|uniref:olfactory receptor 14J1-like n=1 Tax=Cygnus atratus TaxID=8868 RepID=UPI0021B7CDAA|nr:olfactory receptor 14J1-like [Cygnus atratus]
MAYDRYVAICQPLHYGTLLGSRACATMAAAAWGSGFLNAVLHTANTFSLPLCQGNALDQLFCEIPQILKLSCSDSYLREVRVLVVSAFFFWVCFVFIVLSYVQIFRAVLRIPSQQGQHKAFATCLPHIAVVSLFLGTAMFDHLKPPSISSPSLDLAVAVVYAVVPPFWFIVNALLCYVTLPCLSGLVVTANTASLRQIVPDKCGGLLQCAYSIGGTTSVGDMDSVIECSLSEFVDDTKLGGAADMWQGRDTIHRDLDRLERGACAKLMRFSKAKWKY